MVIFYQKNNKKRIEQEDTTYDEEQIEYLLDEDEISIEEAGFMQGYNLKTAK